MSTEPSTEYQSLSDQFASLELEVSGVREEMRAQTAVMGDLLEAWQGAKSLVGAVKVAGAITIKFSAFVLAVSAMVAAVKLWIIGGKP